MKPKWNKPSDLETDEETYNTKDRAAKANESQSKALYTRGQENTGERNQGRDWQWDTGENNEAIKKGGKTEIGSRSAVRTFKLKQEALKEFMSWHKVKNNMWLHVWHFYALVINLLWKENSKNEAR